MSLTHEQAQELFDRYREGDVAADEQRRMDEHLAGCNECRAAYERFLRTMTAVGRLHETRAPSDFVDGVTGQIRRRSRGRFFARPQHWSSRLPYELLSVVMLIAILAIFLFIFIGRGGGAAGSH